MKFSTADLHTDRQWRAATGLDQKRFAKLLTWLPDAYHQIYGQTIQQRHQQCPDEPQLDTYENLLLFTLFSLKSAGPPVRPFLRPAGPHYGHGWIDSQT